MPLLLKQKLHRWHEGFQTIAMHHHRNHPIKLTCSDETKKNANDSQKDWAKEMLPA